MSQASVNIQGGTFNQQAGSLSAPSITNGGTFNYSGGTITGAFQNGGTTTVTGGTALAPNMFGASVMNNSGGNFTVGNGLNSAYVTFMKAVTNNAGATFTIDNSYVTFNGPVVNNGTWITDPSTVIFKGIFTGQNGTITGSPGDTYEFLGSGANTINLGGNAITITTLVLGPGVTLNITDGSLTVTTLFDPTGSNPGIPGLTATNYSMFSAVPIPSAILLFGPGLVGLAAIRRRFKK